MTVPTKSLRWLRLLLRPVLIGLLSVVVVASLVWATLAINYSNLPWPRARQALAVAFAIGTIATFMLLGPWRKALALSAAVFVLVLTWYYLIPASNDRDWQPDVARLTTIDIQGDQLTVHNVRSFHYRSETDFDVRYEDRTYDRSKLIHADLIMSYWAPPATSHTSVTFAS